jgi:hypothetical protein
MSARLSGSLEYVKKVVQIYTMTACPLCINFCDQTSRGALVAAVDAEFALKLR